MIKTIKVLMVGGDCDDVYSLNEALAVAQITSVDVQEVEDGEQALAYLRQEHPFFDVPRPDVIFLEVDLPGMSGIEVLDEIRQDRQLNHIPVAILTQKAPPRTVAETKRNGLPRYTFKKPTNCNEWVYTLRCIEDVWLTIKNVQGSPLR